MRVEQRPGLDVGFRIVIGKGPIWRDSKRFADKSGDRGKNPSSMSAERTCATAH